MKQSAIIHKILSLNKSLYQLNANSKQLSTLLKNPAFEFLQTKITLKHASLNEHFISYSGMMLYQLRPEEIISKGLNSKEKRLRQHQCLLLEVKETALEIEKNIIASEKFKQIFLKINKLSSKQLGVIQQEINLLLNPAFNEFKKKRTSETTVH